MNGAIEITKLALFTLLGTPAVVIFFVWLFRESIKSYLFVGAQNEVNRQKQILDTYTEAMKHSLQREMVRVESYTKNKFSVYPQIFEKILRTHGGLANLYGIKFATNQDRYTEGDLKSQMQTKNVAEGEAEHILELFRQNRDKGIEQFNRLMREIEVHETRRLYHESKNFLLLNELFMSKEIVAMIDKILINIWSVWVDAHVTHISSGHENRIGAVHEGVERLDALISELKESMRSELQP